MSNVVPLQGGTQKLPDTFNQGPAKGWEHVTMETGDEGVDGGYGHLKYKGRKWSVTHRGQTYDLVYGKDAGPAAGKPRDSVDVVFARLSTHKAKTYYPAFKEGQREKPICWSHDGLFPDPSVPPSQKQFNNCTECPLNQFGSKQSPDGKGKGKACADHKRTAVILDPKQASDAVGMPLEEPILLRIPAASLGDLGTFAQRMHNNGYPMASFITRISFDGKVAYPRFVYNEVRPLDEGETEIAKEMRNSALAYRIVADKTVVATTGEPLALPPTGGQGDPSTAAAAPSLPKDGLGGAAVALPEKPQNTAAVKSDADFDARVAELMNK